RTLWYNGPISPRHSAARPGLWGGPPGPGPRMDQPSLDPFGQGCGLARPLELTVSWPATGQTVSFQQEQPYALIGRGSDSHICLQVARGSYRHVYVQAVAGALFGVALGRRTGVHWRGETRRSGRLDPGDALGIGPAEVRSALPPAGPDLPAGW